MNKQKSDDEIMAEHLLKGHKMLPNSCSVCGNPVFSIKGEIICVVCKDRGDIVVQKTDEKNDEKLPKDIEKPEKLVSVYELNECLRATLINLCKKIDSSEDAERCSKLMGTLKTGIEALVMLY